jgi:phosphohistidine phosphatase
MTEMKTLTLLRHAKSDWSDTSLRDFDRPLNDRGFRAAALMGQWAKREDLRFDCVIASPAARVKDTLGRFAQSFGACPEPVWDRRVYLASAETLVDVITERGDGQDNILVVGHNPGLETFILDHVPDDGDTRLRDDVAEKFPTAAIAVLEFDIDSWDELARTTTGPGRIRSFMRPRDLDPALGPERA